MNFRFLFFVVLLTSLLNLNFAFFASANCGDKEPNQIDKDCTESCTSGHENTIQGCYLPPPPPEKSCPDGYSPHETSEICCCKSE